MTYDLNRAPAASGHSDPIVWKSRAASDGDRAAGSWVYKHAANMLTALRLGAAGGWMALFISNPQERIVLGAIAVVAALSDFFDGRLARQLGTSGNAGRWLDGVADVVFVLAVLGCEAWAGAIPAYVPALITASFVQYAADSMILGEASSGPIRSRLGHWGGVINYALALALSFAPPPAPVGMMIKSCAPILALYYIGAMVERALILYRPSFGR